jgi:hypothetical protein
MLLLLQQFGTDVFISVSNQKKKKSESNQHQDPIESNQNSVRSPTSAGRCSRRRRCRPSSRRVGSRSRPLRRTPSPVSQPRGADASLRPSPHRGDSGEHPTPSCHHVSFSFRCLEVNLLSSSILFWNIVDSWIISSLPGDRLECRLGRHGSKIDGAVLVDCRGDDGELKLVARRAVQLKHWSFSLRS